MKLVRLRQLSASRRGLDEGFGNTSACSCNLLRNYSTKATKARLISQKTTDFHISKKIRNNWLSISVAYDRLRQMFRAG